MYILDGYGIEFVLHEKSAKHEGQRRNCAAGGERAAGQQALVGQDVRAPDDLSFERRIPHVYGREEGGCGGWHVSESRAAVGGVVGAAALAQGIPDHEGTGSARRRGHVAGGLRTGPARVAELAGALHEATAR